MIRGRIWWCLFAASWAGAFGLSNAVAAEVVVEGEESIRLDFEDGALPSAHGWHPFESDAGEHRVILQDDSEGGGRILETSGADQFGWMLDFSELSAAFAGEDWVFSADVFRFAEDQGNNDIYIERVREGRRAAVSIGLHEAGWHQLKLVGRQCSGSVQAFVDDLFVSELFPSDEANPFVTIRDGIAFGFGNHQVNKTVRFDNVVFRTFGSALIRVDGRDIMVPFVRNGPRQAQPETDTARHTFKGVLAGLPIVESFEGLTPRDQFLVDRDPDLRIPVGDSLGEVAIKPLVHPRNRGPNADPRLDQQGITVEAVPPGEIVKEVYSQSGQNVLIVRTTVEFRFPVTVRAVGIHVSQDDRNIAPQWPEDGIRMDAYRDGNLVASHFLASDIPERGTSSVFLGIASDHQEFDTMVLAGAAPHDGWVLDDLVFLPVSHLNRPPSLRPVSAVEIDEDSSLGPLMIDVSDCETPTEDLLLEVFSRTDSIFTNDRISVHFEAGNWLLSGEPASNASGEALLELSASDGRGFRKVELRVKVNPVNDPPVITFFTD